MAPLWIYKPVVTSDNGDKDNGEGSNNGGGSDNNHRSSIDTDSNMGSNRVEGSNMVQDRVANWGTAQLSHTDFPFL